MSACLGATKTLSNCLFVLNIYNIFRAVNAMVDQEHITYAPLFLFTARIKR